MRFSPASFRLIVALAAPLGHALVDVLRDQFAGHVHRPEGTEERLQTTFSCGAC
jgi:hypothetical protein